MKRLYWKFISLLLLSALACCAPRDSSLDVDCDFETGPCVRRLRPDILVAFTVEPTPVTCNTDLTFSLLLAEGDTPITDAEVSLDLAMPDMFMGENKPEVKHVSNGRYEGKGVIPVCPFGGKVWRADLEIVWQGRKASLFYTFEVEKNR